jgi:hypothetical protein
MCSFWDKIKLKKEIELVAGLQTAVPVEAAVQVAGCHPNMAN